MLGAFLLARSHFHIYIKDRQATTDYSQCRIMPVATTSGLRDIGEEVSFEAYFPVRRSDLLYLVLFKLLLLYFSPDLRRDKLCSSNCQDEARLYRKRHASDEV
jgi:hypothetical protein